MDTTEYFRQFGLLYRRYLRWLAPLGRYCPGWLWRLPQKTLGRTLSPYQLKASAIRAGLAQAAGTDGVDAAWAAWRDSHAQFVRDFSRYHLLTPMQMQRQVLIPDTDVLAQLHAEGGLLLTYHSHHQNTLCCALGFAGCRVHAVAAAPQTSLLFPYLSRWALQINRESARHFRGGDYLFINDMRHVARSVKQALADKDVVVCLCDFHQPDGSGLVFPLFSRQISPPSGVLDLALRQQAPIYLALCAPEEGQLVLRLSRLSVVDNRASVLAAYIAFLERACRQNPVCWQGWDWFNDLPERVDAQPPTQATLS